PLLERRRDNQRHRQWPRAARPGLRFDHRHHHPADERHHASHLAADGILISDQGHVVAEGGVLMPAGKSRGQALVEFALIFPLLFFLLALSIDLFRVDWVTSTVAEAARQAARQADPNQLPSDLPFAAPTG